MHGDRDPLAGDAMTVDRFERPSVFSDVVDRLVCCPMPSYEREERHSATESMDKIDFVELLEIFPNTTIDERIEDLGSFGDSFKATNRTTSM